MLMNYTNTCMCYHPRNLVDFIMNSYKITRRPFDDNEILDLLILYYTLENKLASLFNTDRLYANMTSWRHQFSRNR